MSDAQKILDDLKQLHMDVIDAEDRKANHVYMGGEFMLKFGRMERILLKIVEEDLMKNGYDPKEISEFQTAISGNWKLHYTSRFSTYVFRKKFPEPEKTVFRTGSISLTFNEFGLDIHQPHKEKTYFQRVCKLAEPVIIGDSGFVTFFSGKRLKTVHLNGETEEIYLDDGYLNVESRYNGNKCSRIYRRPSSYYDVEEEEDELVKCLSDILEKKPIVDEPNNILNEILGTWSPCNQKLASTLTITREGDQLIRTTPTHTITEDIHKLRLEPNLLITFNVLQEKVFSATAWFLVDGMLVKRVHDRNLTLIGEVVYERL